MRKSILIVVGGGRPQGNTAQLVDAFARGAEAADHSLTWLMIRAMIVSRLKKR